MLRNIVFVIMLLGVGVGYTRAQENDAAQRIEYIDIIHMCHTDYGFTDNPLIAEELHRKYFEIGLDAVLESVNDPSKPKFCWTAEVLETVDSWWKDATPEKRRDLLKAIKSGQLEIAAMTFNIHPFYNERLTNKLVNWVSDDMWKKFNPQVAIQHDVNGFPRAVASKMMDKGIRYFWSGLNLHWGGIFHKPPYAFWWEMPDGRKALVWLGMPYWEGYDFFAPQQWRYAQRPASNTQFRSPRPGDMLQADETSVREAHKVCVGRLNQMIKEGYPYDFVAMSLTNQYRCDNDGPFTGFAAFVKKWNELGLKPRLNYITATESMRKTEARIGNKLPTHKGEWPDWWSFGVAASPRELAASRQANLFVEAVLSPAWGTPDNNTKKQIDQIDRDLCRYYEHTFGTWETNRDPYSLFNQAHLNTTSSYAFRPYEKAAWLLAQRVRSKLTNEPEGLYVVNTGGIPYTGWINIDPAAFVRQPYQSVDDPVTGKKKQLYREGGFAKLWVENMAPDRIFRYVFSVDSVGFSDVQPTPEIKTDENGWPVYIKWPEHGEPFLSENFGEMFSFNSLVGRSIVGAWYEPDSVRRKERIARESMENRASYQRAQVVRTPYSVIYTQEFRHSSLKQAVRKIEIWKKEPRLSYKITLDRKSNSDPEILYVKFPFPQNTGFPETSNGGMAFRPYKDQLPGTCTDFLAVDGWVKYPIKKGAWIWSSRDAALITFGGNQFGAKSKQAPVNMNLLCAMIYNNMWEVNFLNDCIGKMEFKFDVMWQDKEFSPKETSDATRTYLLEPVVFVNPATREDKHTYRILHRVE